MASNAGGWWLIAGPELERGTQWSGGGGGGIVVGGWGQIQLRKSAEKLWKIAGNWGKSRGNCDIVSNPPQPSRGNNFGEVDQIFSFGHSKGPWAAQLQEASLNITMELKHEPINITMELKHEPINITMELKHEPKATGVGRCCRLICATALKLSHTVRKSVPHHQQKWAVSSKIAPSLGKVKGHAIATIPAKQ